jgi:hypothetical protein
MAAATLIGCVVGAVLDLVLGGPVVGAVALAVVALAAVVDLAVVLGRKRRGEPG